MEDGRLANIWSKILLEIVTKRPKDPIDNICQILNKMSTEKSLTSQAVHYLQSLQQADHGDITEQIYHIFTILMNSTGETELKHGLPHTIYRDFVDHLIDNEDQLVKEVLAKFLYEWKESYLPFEKLQDVVKFYLSLKEYYQLANGVYDSVGVMTKELAEKLLNHLSDGKERPHPLQLNTQVCREEFVRATLSVFISHNT